MTNTTPKISGIQVYGSNNKILNNKLDKNAGIYIGAGESNKAPGTQPKGDHLPADNAVIEGNEAGTLVLSYHLNGTGKNGRKYQFKAKNVVVRGNNFTSKVDDKGGADDAKLAKANRKVVLVDTGSLKNRKVKVKKKEKIIDVEKNTEKTKSKDKQDQTKLVDQRQAGGGKLNQTVKPGDKFAKIQKILDNAAPGGEVVFQEGTYAFKMVDKKKNNLNVNAKNLTLRSNNAELSGQLCINLNCPGVTIEGFTFVGNIDINAKVNDPPDPATMGRNAVIRNNTFRDHKGYAKRIRVASTSEHESIAMNPLIQNNAFIKIHGGNNRRIKDPATGKDTKNRVPGGELISIKASGAKILNNTFDDVWGRISLRGGENSTVEDNTFTNLNPPDPSDPEKYLFSTGIQVYGSNNQLLNNTLDERGTIILGTGESDKPAGKQPFGDHLAANNAVVTGNKAGILVLNYNFGKKGKARNRPEDIEKFGKERRYTFKPTGITRRNNEFGRIVNQGKDK